MNADTLTTHLSDAEEALQGFFAQLLGAEATVDISAPAETTLDAHTAALTDGLVLSEPAGYAVLLDTALVPLIAEALLGQPMDASEDGAADLVSEISSQGYGAVRTQLSESGIQLPEASFEVTPPEDDAPDLPATLWSLEFVVTVDGDEMPGTAFFERSAPPPPSDATEPESAPEPDATQQQATQQQATQQQAASQAAPTGSTVAVGKAQFSELDPDAQPQTAGVSGNFEMLAEVELDVRVELGRRELPLADVLQLTSGSVIELEKLVGEPLSIYANGRFIAEGEAVVIDEKFGVRITNLAPKQQRSKALL